MIAPVHRLKKNDIIWLANHRCKHGHTYLEHYSCYLKEHPDKQERIGFLDIEASNLDANFGIIYSYCIKDSQSNKIYYDVFKKEDIKRFPPEKVDKRVVAHLIKDLMRFDRIIGHYSSRFDIPFIRTRALACGLKFPNYASLKQGDTWSIVRSKLKLNSNRLGTVSEILFGKTEKTVIKPRYWIGASWGDKKSLNYILKHNKIDVLELEKVYYKVIDYIRIQNTSI